MGKTRGQPGENHGSTRGQPGDNLGKTLDKPGEDLGTTWGPFKWENLRTWGPFKWENLRERTHPPTPLIHTQDQWEELQPMKVARTGLGVSSLQVHHICEIHSCSTCACNRAGILSFENFCQRLLYAVQSRLNHTH